MQDRRHSPRKYDHCIPTKRFLFSLSGFQLGHTFFICWISLPAKFGFVKKPNGSETLVTNIYWDHTLASLCQYNYKIEFEYQKWTVNKKLQHMKILFHHISYLLFIYFFQIADLKKFSCCNSNVIQQIKKVWPYQVYIKFMVGKRKHFNFCNWSCTLRFQLQKIIVKLSLKFTILKDI